MAPPFIHFTNPGIVKRTSAYVSGNAAKISMKSLFTDNSRVHYKPHSLAPGGVGTVRNSRHKSKFT